MKRLKNAEEFRLEECFQMALPGIECHQNHPVGKVSYHYNEGLMFKAVRGLLVYFAGTDRLVSLVYITVIVLQSDP